jgi:hypothetical protein
MVRRIAFSDILLHLEEFLDICKQLGLQAQAEAGRFGSYRSRIAHLNSELERLRAGESALPIYRKLAAELPRYLAALVESQEVGEFVPFLLSRPPDEVLPRVKAVLAGPELPSLKICPPIRPATFSLSCCSPRHSGELD